jgi:hypothetical protein
MALGYGLDGRGFDSWQGLGIFLFTTASRPVLGPSQLPIQSVKGALSLEVKRPRRETDHLPPSSYEVKRAWRYTSTPQNAFMTWCSVKTQGQLYLYITESFHAQTDGWTVTVSSYKENKCIKVSEKLHFCYNYLTC